MADAEPPPPRSPVLRRRGADEPGWPWFVRLVAFVSVLAVLFFGAYIAGRSGYFSRADDHLASALHDPSTRVEAISTIANRLATGIAQGHPVFAGASGDGTCPDRYTSRATSIIEAMDAAESSKVIADARARLRDTGWRVDPSPAGTSRRNTLTAHNRQNLELVVNEVVGTNASSIEVQVTLPCGTNPATGSTSQPPSTLPSRPVERSPDHPTTTG